jgi:CBS domain-containing protein
METTVRRLLEDKGSQVWTVAPDTSALDALQLMADHDIGALMVTADGQLAGIITERDYARKIALSDRRPADVTVRDIMSERVVYVRPEQTVDQCMAIMTDRRLRHLPVLDGERLVGVISIRDVVAHVVSDKEFLIEQLTNYITT